jgi:hypothetical protein
MVRVIGHTVDGFKNAVGTAWEATVHWSSAEGKAARQRIETGITNTAEVLGTLIGPSGDDMAAASIYTAMTGNTAPMEVMQAANRSRQEAYQNIGQQIKQSWNEAKARNGNVGAVAMVLTEGVNQVLLQKGVGVASDLAKLSKAAMLAKLGEAAEKGEQAAQDAVKGATVATAENARGLSKLGGVFTSTTNEAGGTVWTSAGTITQNDFAGIVNSELMQGRNVNIISGVHGGVDGTILRIDSEMHLLDVDKFGQMPGVTVHNYPSLTSQQITDLLRGTDTTIGGFCNSGVCLAPHQ